MELGFVQASEEENPEWKTVLVPNCTSVFFLFHFFVLFVLLVAHKAGCSLLLVMYCGLPDARQQPPVL